MGMAYAKIEVNLGILLNILGIFYRYVGPRIVRSCCNFQTVVADGALGGLRKGFVAAYRSPLI